MIKEFKDTFFEIINTSEKIVITSHISPDDDSIGSVLSLYTILKSEFSNKDINIIYSGEIIDRYNVFHNFENIKWVDDISNHILDCDLLIMLDGSKYFRFSKNPEILEKIKNRVCIDHHQSPDINFTLYYIDPNYSSNCELIYKILDAEKYLNSNLAELFLLGILGDTGNLIHINSNQTEVFSIVKKLVEVGEIRIDSFLSKYRTIPKIIVPILQEFVKNTTYIDIPNWPSAQYSFITKQFLKDKNLSDEDISAASHIYMSQYLTRIEGQSWGFVFSPRFDNDIRMSSRSMIGSVNVRIFSEQLGIGGGHDRASGASFKSEKGEVLEVEDCIEKVLDFMKKNVPVLS